MLSTVTHLITFHDFFKWTVSPSPAEWVAILNSEVIGLTSCKKTGMTAGHRVYLLGKGWCHHPELNLDKIYNLAPKPKLPSPFIKAVIYHIMSHSISPRRAVFYGDSCSGSA